MENRGSSGNISNLNETLRWLDRIYHHAQKLSCHIDPSSRVGIFAKHLNRFRDPAYKPQKDSELNPDILTNGNRDLFEIFFICEKLGENHSNELKSRLPFLLKGSVIPSDDGQNQKVRNRQFELFFAARLLHSGFEIKLEEPDIIFCHDGVSYPVAAKQPVSQKKIIRRVREGIKQIEKRHRNGFISLSFDCVIPTPHGYLIAKNEAGLDDAPQSILETTFQQFEKKIHRAVSNSTITGIFVSLTLVGCVQYPWQVAQTSTTFSLPRDINLPKEEAITRSILDNLKSPYNN